MRKTNLYLEFFNRMRPLSIKAKLRILWIIPVVVIGSATRFYLKRLEKAPLKYYNTDSLFDLTHRAEFVKGELASLFLSSCSVRKEVDES